MRGRRLGQRRARGQRRRCRRCRERAPKRANVSCRHTAQLLQLLLEAAVQRPNGRVERSVGVNGCGAGCGIKARLPVQRLEVEQKLRLAAQGLEQTHGRVCVGIGRVALVVPRGAIGSRRCGRREGGKHSCNASSRIIAASVKLILVVALAALCHVLFAAAATQEVPRVAAHAPVSAVAHPARVVRARAVVSHARRMLAAARVLASHVVRDWWGVLLLAQLARLLATAKLNAQRGTKPKWPRLGRCWRVVGVIFIVVVVVFIVVFIVIESSLCFGCPALLPLVLVAASGALQYLAHDLVPVNATGAGNLFRVNVHRHVALNLMHHLLALQAGNTELDAQPR